MTAQDHKQLHTELKEVFREYLETSRQSGKQETSSLVYSMKEIIEQRFGEMNQHLVEIKEQVKKTNGRVSSLELSRSYLWGSVAVLLLLGGGIISLGLSYLSNEIDRKIYEHEKIQELGQ